MWLSSPEGILFASIASTVLLGGWAYQWGLRFFGWRWWKTAPIDGSTLFDDSEALPSLVIVIPVFNEVELIEEKLANLLSLSYLAKKRRILVVDGGSTDGTLERVRAFSQGPTIEIINSEKRGKIAQLNAALASIEDEAIVVVTDADTQIEKKDALLRTGALFAKHPDVSVLGGVAQPPISNHIPSVERAYWDQQNTLRLIESEMYAASIVVAPYYAFRRNLFSNYPEDCIADDIFVAFRSHAQEKRVVFHREIPVTEIRQPASLKELFFHKLRKGQAYLIELLRFFPRLLLTSPQMSWIYGYKLFQFLWLPIAALLLLGTGLRATLSGHGLEVLAWILCLKSLVYVTQTNASQDSQKATIPLWEKLLGFSVIGSALIANLLSFPFWRQGASYAKTTGRA